MTEFAKLCGSNAPHILMFIGGGNMASALVDGCIKSGFISVNQIAISCRSKNTNDKWKMRDSVYESLRGSVLLNGISLVISLLAGIDIDVLRKELDLVKGLASKVGMCLEIDAKSFNAASAIAGCGPAWVSCFIFLLKISSSYKRFSVIIVKVYMFIESLADGGVLSGCSRETAMKLAAQTVMSGEHPASLKDKVCSPAGTSIVGLRQLEKAGENCALRYLLIKKYGILGFRSAIIEAVKSASDRANSL
uniref:Pyrroline-5-carboxylate reductase n=1 Tax=Heterorhabditis bacteriophora TaxID=37862 RepID=A0A1I7WMX4_HETBA